MTGTAAHDTETVGRAQLRRLRVRADLVAEARRLTADVGLAGFTLDQLCSTVGISRRTFFNHFASKDHVVMGVSLDDDEDDALERYASSRRDPRLPPLSTVFDDLSVLVVLRIEQIGLTRERATAFQKALEREPRLFGAILREGGEQKRRILAAVARHEGLAPDDVRVDTAVTLATALVQRAVEQFFFEIDDPAARFDDVLARWFDQARTLFSPPTTDTDREAR
ncbi:TetR/AcrR family transcriptional regulator [Frigoribacterium faeni]|uniref:AcrR family transcriptional regulator n=1 Tax=Frigoribacterium faeni TaxID=145483 RepID=A0A7W3JH31_9MICO|nr:TetR/AcrR family transcriptional regulator [Frigoribacterium faeni]MBA8812747.1 AcrR family transcriptional regulator [Frigoribacterium faeni]BFF13863.1 TetR family transcriptional regulator [Microbacterium flavescens]GEK82238.1 TetR family transcriptional regulator [Frigoribacterium faeni]